MTDYFAAERIKEVEQQNEILRYRKNELKREIDTLRELLAVEIKKSTRWEKLRARKRKKEMTS